MTYSQRLLKIFLIITVACSFTANLSAQKNGGETREFPAYGFSFRPLKDWADTPQQPSAIAAGRIGQFSAEKPVRVSLEDNRIVGVSPSLIILRITPQRSVTTGSSGGLKERVAKEEVVEATVHDHVFSLYGNGLTESVFKKIEANKSDPKIKKVDAKREELSTFYVSAGGPSYDIHFDVYTIQLPDAKLLFIWDYPATSKKDLKKWQNATKKAMKTFKFDPDSIEEFNADAAPDSAEDYDSIIEFHKQEVAQTPGWRLIETRSKDYVIKTNCDDKKSIKLAIKRLEASRKLYEQDFPPEKEITNVSVVRICNTREEFQAFSGTGGGVAGYFSPRSEELVLFFGENTMGLDMTLAVMSHEGFHQYGYFLFNRANPHQWFGEGHGDYYGAFKMVGSKLKNEEDMKGGLARIPEIKKMIANGDVVPTAEHVRYTHQQWQKQGPRNVSCYAQSFTLVYFLREGARGRVKSKYFKKEYKEIIPNYLASVINSYNKAYVDVVAEYTKELELATAAGADRLDIQRIQGIIDAPWNYINPEVETELRKKAIDDSWGKIDEDAFHDNWLNFVKKEL